MGSQRVGYSRVTELNIVVLSHSVMSNYLRPHSPPGSSVQARILEWVAIPSPAYSQPKDQTQVSCIAGRLFHLSYQGNPVNTVLFEKDISRYIIKAQMSIYRIKTKQNYPQNYQKDNRESTEKWKKKIFQRSIKIENKITELKLYMVITIINVNEVNLWKEKYSNRSNKQNQCTKAIVNTRSGKNSVLVTVRQRCF